MALTGSGLSRSLIRSRIELACNAKLTVLSAVVAIGVACSAPSPGISVSPVESRGACLDAGVPADGADIRDEIGDAGSPAATPIDATPALDARGQVLGWHCYQMRRTPNSKSFTGSCKKRIEGCERVREPRLNREKLYVTRCLARTKAFCFQVANEVERYEEFMCFETEVQCYRAREYAMKITGPDTTWTDCDEYE